MKIEYQKDLPDGSAIFTMDDASEAEIATLVSRGMIAVLEQAIKDQELSDKYAQEGWCTTPVVLSVHNAKDDPLDITKAVHVTLSRDSQAGASVNVMTQVGKIPEGQAAQLSKAFNRLLHKRID